METTKETSVSMLVMTRLKLTADGPVELVAVLQVRGPFNFETQGPESWPRACRHTAHGKANPGEKLEVALHRVMVENLGAAIALACTAGKVEIVRVETGEKVFIHYAAEIPPGRINLMALGASTGGLRLLRESEVANIHNLRTIYSKEAGVTTERGVIAMFPDEIEAARKAFAHFNQAQPGATPQT